jgi:uncharacterized membrane protein YhaH (DUF805 family)
MNGLGQFLSFSGRINRGTFWKYFLGSSAANLGLLGLAVVLEPHLPDVTIAVVLWTANIALLWPVLATFAKRWHDRGAPAWFALFVFVPLANIWTIIECGFVAGDAGRNKYGDPPIGLALPSEEDGD